jgi:hypothetical protein
MIANSRTEGTSMNALQDDIKPALPKTEAATSPSQAIRGVRVLSPQEINAVAGGPEGSVGTGINPP